MIIVLIHQKDQLEQLKSDLMKSGKGKEPEVLCLDVASKSEIVNEKVEEMIKKFEYIDVLINNAGVSFRGEVIYLVAFLSLVVIAVTQ